MFHFVQHDSVYIVELGHDLALAQTTTWRLSLLALFAVVAVLASRWWRRRHVARARQEP